MKLRVILVLSLVATVVVAKGGLEDDDDINEMQERTPEAEYRNPCNNNNHRCKRGEICVLDEQDQAVCQCQTCEDDQEPSIKVCSSKNVTYNSECELDRDHCLCKRGLDGCSRPGETKVKLDYYAACKVLTKCPDEELMVFPGRVREWLFRGMRALANRAELDGDERDWLEAAGKDKKHAGAVIWKYCQLDADPDRRVTRRELMDIITTVKPMEHCLVRFLNNCDLDDDGAITLMEWGTCLEIEPEQLQENCKPTKN